MHVHQFLVSVASPVSEMVLFKLGQISLLDHDTVQPVNFVDKYFCDCLQLFTRRTMFYAEN